MQQCTPTRDLNTLKLISSAIIKTQLRLFCLGFMKGYTTQLDWDCNESLLGMCFFCTATIGPFDGLLPPN